MVFGHPTTLTDEFLLKKYYDNKAAFVLESSPPITTSPSSFKLSQYFRDF